MNHTIRNTLTGILLGAAIGCSKAEDEVHTATPQKPYTLIATDGNLYQLTIPKELTGQSVDQTFFVREDAVRDLLNLIPEMEKHYSARMQKVGMTQFTPQVLAQKIGFLDNPEYKENFGVITKEEVDEFKERLHYAVKQ